MDPMTIVHIVRTLECGGLERVAVDLAIAQKNRGHSAVIYCVYKHEPELQDEAERAGVRVVQFNKETGFSFRTLRKMAAQLRRDCALVVHTHNELVHTYGTMAGRLAGVRCIVNTIHGTKAGVDWRLNRNYRVLLPWTDAVVSVSHETAAQFASERLRYRDKFHIIPNGIQVSKFMAQSAQPGSQWPRIRIGTVARLAEIKDQATLIRAFQIVHKAFPGAELHLLGDGPLRNNLELLANQLELGRSVTFHGASPNVAEFLSGLDLFALSSLSEGLPIAVLEAMAAGLPIVSTRVGGTPEAAPEHEAAEYCPPGNAEALAQAMQSILDSQRLAAMGRAAHVIAKRSFSIEARERAYEAVYQISLSKKFWRWDSLLPGESKNL
jgi:glycosyltransferase involved in cell wall biosynthesis